MRKRAAFCCPSQFCYAARLFRVRLKGGFQLGHKALPAHLKLHQVKLRRADLLV
jgi:hypothetical protein